MGFKNEIRKVSKYVSKFVDGIAIDALVGTFAVQEIFLWTAHFSKWACFII